MVCTAGFSSLNRPKTFILSGDFHRGRCGFVVRCLGHFDLFTYIARPVFPHRWRPEEPTLALTTSMKK